MLFILHQFCSQFSTKSHNFIILALHATSGFSTHHLIGQQPAISTLFKILTRLSKMLKKPKKWSKQLKKTFQQLQLGVSSNIFLRKITMQNIKPNQTSVERITCYLSLYKSTTNKQHTHKDYVFYGTRVQHVRVSSGPSILFGQPHASSTAAITYISRCLKSRHTVVCAALHIFLPKCISSSRHWFSHPAH